MGENSKIEGAIIRSIYGSVAKRSHQGVTIVLQTDRCSLTLASRLAQDFEVVLGKYQ